MKSAIVLRGTAWTVIELSSLLAQMNEIQPPMREVECVVECVNGTTPCETVQKIGTQSYSSRSEGQTGTADRHRTM